MLTESNLNRIEESLNNDDHMIIEIHSDHVVDERNIVLMKKSLQSIFSKNKISIMIHDKDTDNIMKQLRLNNK